MAPFIGHQKHAVRCGAQSGVIFSLIEKSRLIVRRLRSQRHRNRTSGLIHSPPELRDESGEQIPIRGYNILEIHVYTGKLFLILPTIITVAQSALDAVPKKYYEGALALGADHERSVFRVIVPAAVSGIMAGIVLGVGRAIGETMAVIMVAGNQPIVPESIFEGVRTMTANIVLEMGYAADLHRGALVATGVVLFVFILLITMLFNVIKKRGETR